MDLFWDDEGFFTREDLVEYVEGPLEDLIQRSFGIPYEFLGIKSYIEDGNRLEVDFKIYDNEFTLTSKIDFRRIRAPRDLEKYTHEIYRELVTTHLPSLIAGR